MLNEAEILRTSTTEEVLRNTQMYPDRAHQHDRHRRGRKQETHWSKSSKSKGHKRHKRQKRHKWNSTIGPFAATLLFTLILALCIWGDKFP